MKPFDSTEIRSQLKNNIPPPMREAYDKVVAAGMKFMFDKSTHKFMQQEMSSEGPIDDKLATGILGLIEMLMSQSKGAFPHQLIIPAGIELMLHAADYAAQTGSAEVTAELMASAIQKFTIALFDKVGVPEQQLMGGIAKIGELSGQQDEEQ
jgi:hypothetical protein